MRPVFVLITLIALAGCGGGLPRSAQQPDDAGNMEPDTGGDTTAASIGHVFIIVLENKNFSETFGADSPALYLAQTLPAEGAFLSQYYATGHLSLDNYITMISGQAPNPQTQADCQSFADWTGTDILDADGQAIGEGCVYPATALTVANQLEAAGISWKGYMEDMGNNLERDGSATCAHPALDAQDGTQSAAADDQYATRHNPFVYFHSIIDDQALCDAHDVPLTELETDLASEATTPHYAFITPNLCNDGHDTGCANGDPGGLESADAFLQTWVPRIVNSAAFKHDGLLIVTFDEAEAGPSNPAGSDASSCCGEQAGPNSPLPGIFGPGGGLVGAVMLSPLIRPGTVSDVPYNHYSMLRSVEDIFGLDHLGYAAQDGLVPFGDDIFTNRPGA